MFILIFLNKDLLILANFLLLTNLDIKKLLNEAILTVVYLDMANDTIKKQI